MNLTLITSQPDEILIALRAGIDRIMIDLERETKITRQKGRDLFLSDHNIADLRTVRRLFPDVSLTVRINSIHSQSCREIREIGHYRPDRIMLPFFQSMAEVDTFLELLPCGVAPILLFENRASLRLLEQVIEGSLAGEVFIGLNDLTLDLGHDHLARTLLEPIFEESIARLEQSNLTWGFGGVGSLADPTLIIHPRQFLLFQLCLGSQSGWLSRSFRRLFHGGAAAADDVHEVVRQIRQLQEDVAVMNPMIKRALVREFRQELILISDAS